MTTESTQVPPRPDKPPVPEGVEELYVVTCKSGHIALGIFFTWDQAVDAAKQAHKELGCMFKPVPFVPVFGVKMQSQLEQPIVNEERDWRGGQYL